MARAAAAAAARYGSVYSWIHAHAALLARTPAGAGQPGGRRLADGRQRRACLCICCGLLGSARRACPRGWAALGVAVRGAGRRRCHATAVSGPGGETVRRSGALHPLRGPGRVFVLALRAVVDAAATAAPGTAGPCSRLTDRDGARHHRARHRHWHRHWHACMCSCVAPCPCGWVLPQLPMHYFDRAWMPQRFQPPGRRNVSRCCCRTAPGQQAAARCCCQPGCVAVR